MNRQDQNEVASTRLMQFLPPPQERDRLIGYMLPYTKLLNLCIPALGTLSLSIPLLRWSMTYCVRFYKSNDGR